MKLWNPTHYAWHRQSQHVDFQRKLTTYTRYLRQQGFDEAYISKKRTQMYEEWGKQGGLGVAKGVRGSVYVAVRNLRKRLKEERRAEMKRKLAEVVRLRLAGVISHEEAEKILDLERKRLAAKEKEELEKISPDPPRKKGLLGETHLSVLQAPRWTETSGGPKRDAKPLLLFGPWWERPKTEKLECDTWKAADLFYQTVPERTKDFLRDLIQRPHRSTYDEWMGHTFWHMLRGIKPAMFPFTTKPALIESATPSRTGKKVREFYLAVGGSVGEAVSSSVAWGHVALGLAVLYVGHLGRGFLGALLSNKRVVYPYIGPPETLPLEMRTTPDPVFLNADLYAAYVAFWTSSPPGYPPLGQTVVTMMLRSSHWQNSRPSITHSAKILQPTYASFYVRFRDTKGVVSPWDWKRMYKCNETVEMFGQSCWPTEAVWLEYHEGRKIPLTWNNYFDTTWNQGVFGYDDPDHLEYGCRSFEMGWFDGLHAWVHWPYPPNATRYSMADPPPWWFAKTYTWYGRTYRRYFPEHAYTGHPSLNPKLGP